jgi:hypothetical protein
MSWLDVQVMTTPEGTQDGRRAAGTDQLTWAEVAEMAKLPVQTVMTYRQRGALPEPDGYLGRTPWWYRSTIAHWLQVRPLRGQRGRGRPRSTGPAPGAT